jgi:hypothetical protein
VFLTQKKYELCPLIDVFLEKRLVWFFETKFLVKKMISKMLGFSCRTAAFSMENDVTKMEK